MNDWTNVNDSKPTGDTRIVVLARGDRFPEVIYLHVDVWEGRCWKYYTGERYSKQMMYWMEIPTLPKPEPRFVVRCALMDFYLPGWYKVYDTRMQKVVCYFRNQPEAVKYADRRNAE